MSKSCFCVGPQNGAPCCPCMMKDVIIHNGRYKRVIDLGPAPNGGLPRSLFEDKSFVKPLMPDESKVVPMYANSEDYGHEQRTQVRDLVTGRSLGPAD